MSITETSELELQRVSSGSPLTEDIRNRALELCKDFKTSWVQLGQMLYAVYQDKLYHQWGYEKFEHYTKKELGFKKEVAMKMLRSYLYLEDEEPAYLKKEFVQMREAPKVPSLEEINVLRLAKGKKELPRQDYMQLKKAIFEKGRDAGAVKKELTAMMKERNPVDPEVEREKRNEAILKNLVNSLSQFKKEAGVLKLMPHKIIEDAETLLKNLKEQLPKQAV